MSAPLEKTPPENIGEIPLFVDYLSEDHPNRTNETRTVKYIVVHDTGNKSAGSNAQAHNEYIHKNTERAVSWHYSVDDKQIYQHLPGNEAAWHAGDKLKENGGNLNGIGIEMCVNEDGDFTKTRHNTAQLIAYLLKTYKLKITDIKQHADFMDKNCPATIRDNDMWEDFLKEVQTELDIINKTS